MRLARLEAVPEDMLMEVDKVLTSQLIAMGGKEGKKWAACSLWPKFSTLSTEPPKKKCCLKLKKTPPRWLKISATSCLFEDCRNIDDRGVREMLKEISNEDLTAPRGASDDLKEKPAKNMSERAGNMIREELEYMGPTNFRMWKCPAEHC